MALSYCKQSMSSMKTKLTPLSIFIFFGCSDNEQAPTVILEEFQPYIDTFQAEAASRGYTIDLSGLSVTYSENLGDFCGWGANFQIQIKGSCWSTFTESQKEELMFHEIGHAVFRRQHLEDVMPNSSQKSIMTTAFGVYNDFTPEKRSYYIDELLDETTAIPSWASAKTNTREISINSTVDISEEGWIFINQFDENNDINRTASRTNELSNDSNFSLKIEGESTVNESGFSFWRLIIPTPDVVVGSQLKVVAKIKTENIAGRGVVLSLRGDNNETEERPFFVTTATDKYITGTNEFTQYNALLDYYPTGVNEIRIYLVMRSQTTGTVYFDDIQLFEKF